jgi:hypothetical protein
MVQLPTLDVTSAQATRIQNAFPGGTQAEKAEAYRTWLRQAIRQYVVMKERETLQAQYEADVAASAAAVETELGTI